MWQPAMIESTQSSPDIWDVIIVGGALSGGAAALELLRRNGELRILIIESSEQHGRRTSLRQELHQQCLFVKKAVMDGEPFEPFLMN